MTSLPSSPKRRKLGEDDTHDDEPTTNPTITATKRRVLEEEEEEEAKDEQLLRLQSALQSSSPVVVAKKTNETTSHRRGSGIHKFSITKKGDLRMGRDDDDDDDDDDTAVFQSLIELHDLVTNQVPIGVTWGEAKSLDPRRRRYAFLPGQRQRLLDFGIRIETLDTQDPTEHERAMLESSLDILWKEEVDKEASTGTSIIASSPQHQPKKVVLSKTIYHALEAITTQIQSLVSKDYQKYVTLSQLVAVQPNHHNGATYLPAHLDFPRADGFGIVIATVAIRHATGSKVILIDEGDDDHDDQASSILSWSMDLQDGDCYILSGNARNKCLHGILGRGTSNNNNNDSGKRETLNLRYALHTKEFAHEEIDRHWPE
jgi:hypothetical protein